MFLNVFSFEFVLGCSARTFSCDQSVKLCFTSGGMHPILITPFKILPFQYMNEKINYKIESLNE